MSTKNASFAKLGPADQDAIVTALQNSLIPNAPMGFFNTIRTHTIEGTFSDPFYGGNYHCAGWDLIRYPESARPFRPSISSGGSISNQSPVRV